MYGPPGLIVQYLDSAGADPMAAIILLSGAGTVKRVRLFQPHGGDFDADIPHESAALPGDPRWRYIPSAS